MAGEAEEGATWHRQTDKRCVLCVSLCNYIATHTFLAIQAEENKVKKSIKDAAKKGQSDVAKILAKELIQSRKAVGKLYASKAHMNSVVMSMQQQLCKTPTLTTCTSTAVPLFLYSHSNIAHGRSHWKEH